MAYKQNSSPASQKPLNLVADALKLDSDNDDENAYLKYLESISVIAATLFDGQKYEKHDSRYLSAGQKQKLLSVARQCLDRAEALTHKLQDVPISSANVPDLVSIEGSKNGDRPLKNSTSVKSNVSAKSTADIIEFGEDAAIPQLIFGSPSRLSSAAASKGSDNKTSVLEFIDWIATEEPLTNRLNETPMEKVQRDNQALVAAYRGRMERNSNHAYRMNLSLELQRRLAENLFVARMQQEQYLRRQREEQQQTMDEAAKRVTDTGDSKEFQRQQRLHAKIILYENTQNWVSDCKNQLSRSPEDADLAESIVRRTLRDQKHPISVELRRRQTKIYNRIQPLIDRTNRPNEGGSHQKVTPKVDLRCEDFNDDANGQTGCLDSDEEIDDRGTTRHRIAGDVEQACEAFQSAIADNLRDIKASIDTGNAVTESLKRSTKKSKKASVWSPVRSLAKFRFKGKTDAEPLSREEEEELERELARLETSALQKHLQTITGDIRQSIDDLIETMVLTYPAMGEVTNRERCYAVLEEQLFPELWPSLMRLCQLVYGTDQGAVADAMQRLRGCAPGDLGCSTEFVDSLLDPEHLANAVALLKAVPEFTIPTKKLLNLVLVTKLICRRNVGLNGENKEVSKSKSIGADDLVGLLNYICVQANVPQLISECHLLEELIHQRYLMGEEGYCLTSLTTSLQYLKTFERIPPKTCGVETTV